MTYAALACVIHAGRQDNFRGFEEARALPGFRTIHYVLGQTKRRGGRVVMRQIANLLRLVRFQPAPPRPAWHVGP